MPSRRRLAILASILLLTPAARAQAPPQGAPARRPFARPGAARKVEPIRVFDVRHIKGELTLDPVDGEVRGTVTHTIASLVPSLDALTLDCASELTVSAVAVGPKGATKASGYQQKGEALVVALEPALGLGREFEVAVTYSGRPNQGIYFVRPDVEHPDRPVCIWTQGESEETRHWLPCMDYPNDRATSEMIVTVPKPMSVLSNGALVDSKENADGTSTYHWKMDFPHVSYLISLAAADFNVVRDEAGALPLQYYVLRGVDDATARRAMGHTPRMVKFFGEATGQPYPYAKYAQVCVPEFTAGGMENISATTLNDAILRDATSYLESDSDSLVAHELAHQWFGDLITCRDWSNVWLNEGFATYFDALFAESDRGEDAFRLVMAGDQQSYLGPDRFVRRSIVESRYADTIQMFDSVTYSKGACVLHALRGLIGDEAWWKGIRGYVAANKGKVVATDDFRKAMEAASGRDLGWFFDQWVFKGGHPELTASWRFEEADKTLRLKVDQTQAVDDLTPLFRLPTTVQIGDDLGIREVPIVVDGRSTEFAIACPNRPEMVRVDPKGWLIKELTFEKPTAEWAYQLDHSPEILGRVEAARALARRSVEPAAAEALARAWTRETAPQTRLAIVRAVAEGGEPARPALVAAAADADPKVRVAALQGLGKLPIDAASEALDRAAWADESAPYGARKAALQALIDGKVKDREALIAAGLASPAANHEFAQVALGAVLADGGPKAREAAALYSRSGQPLALRRAAIRGLASIAKDDAQAESALIALVDDPSRAARLTAAASISQAGLTSALPALEARLAKTRDLTRMMLEPAVAALRQRAKPAAGAPETAAANPAEAADLERRADDLELQAKELRNKAEAIKLKERRSKLGAEKPAA